ncbi:2-hydroxyacid dehydrogenase [Ancylobacter defluvii]|uniref:Glyoxylate/hydroxypyruvate reductase A n=1 Tax=Ancylobacter defluvii TaxID=1282440 RepID=A0A9W6JV48_9HYPH|nr:glyoxylate/hydroxypyruvate reductase A [Ancylobacter defluvii]MBS7590216.1 glyoxylate/hydroxypyruvate reductase A [Ancylobacter defluvii]GLK82859.1 glyoxylate/hydroxypyruvate reductase A [Ancylobacter defluvii]
MAILTWLHNAYGRDLIDGIRAALPDEDIREWPEAGNPDDIDICIVFRMPPGFLKPFRNLKLMSATGAGIDHYLLDPDFPRGIRMVRVVDHDFAARMADYVLAWTLFHHRDLAHFLAAQARHDWAYKIMRSASDVRVGVMGLGQMGRLAAERLAAIGYDTAAWSRSPHEVPSVTCFHGAGGLDDFLGRTEILVNLLPLTHETRGILGAATFARMPAGGVVISAARGGHLVEADLVAALQAGTLRAATIDAFPTEPLPADSPLWEVPNLYVTPHCSSTASLQTIVDTFTGNVRRFRDGQPLLNEVDTIAGY